ncbi:MAG: flagellar hook protein FlgE [Candidatus Competibacteraceae bacterium]|nr:MAG: flagellar hook protein FlgE [Candidatus Competibacteraceae bacterium]
MSMNIALTGLKAATTDLGVVSNNIANSNTTGFKTSRAEFGDMVGGNAVNSTGLGVQLQTINQQFKQGNVDTTGRNLDLAISGEGFFQLSASTGTVYSRAGSFSLQAPSPDSPIQYIVNNLDQNLMGYPAVNGKISAAGETQKLFIDTSAMPGTATANANFNINLDAAEANPLDPDNFDLNDASTFHYSTALTVYDSLGISHEMRLYFIREDPTANTWTVKAALDGGVPITAGPPVAYTVYDLGELEFDENGLIVQDDPPTDPPNGVFADIDIDPDNSAADPLTITFNLSEVTQFGGQYIASSLLQDGNAMGSFTGLTIDDRGIIYGRYSNGKTEAIGQVALADFPNPQGLQPVGDTNWIATSKSGEALVGAPQTGTLGKLMSGALEASNVDLTEQLVNMIVAQRNFQANAQVITTNNTLYQTILNVR